MRTRIFGFPKKLKRSQNYDFLQKIKAALCSAAFPLRLLTIIRLALAD